VETAALTILGGVSVYVIGQLLTKLFLEPVHELRLHVGQVADALLYFANIYYNANSNVVSGEERAEASRALRRTAAELVAHGQAVLWFSPFTVLRLIPSWRDIRDARRALMGLSNSFGNTNMREIDDLRRKVEKALRMRSSF
jgi:hypothetical protein